MKASGPERLSLPSLLLADPSPNLRLLALCELMGRGDSDREVGELFALREQDPIVAGLLRTQRADGSWVGDGHLLRGSPFRVTTLALMRLGYLGFRSSHPAVRLGAEYLFDRQDEDGSWQLPGQYEEGDEDEGYSMVPLQTAIPLRALAMCGCATDERAEKAYEWLLAQRLPDGAWPTGIASGNYGYVAGYRRLAHSRWGCRSNTTGALACLAYHPQRRQQREASRALDLLLGRETRERHHLGFEVARLIGAEPWRGFMTFYARFDLAMVLDLCWRVGITKDDARVADVIAFVHEQQGSWGLWEYLPQPQASRWLTFDLLRSLSQLQAREAVTEWWSDEPRVPFQPYRRHARRF